MAWRGDFHYSKGRGLLASLISRAMITLMGFEHHIW
jgi:hypothetical protein